jgi:glycosyltransferase involved in cell wall biosynthesis
MFYKEEQQITNNWKSDSQIPLVSIVCITYNHEKYIAKTLDSFLMQTTDFSFEILVGEDCSTDNTLHILKKYKEKYPTIIKIITGEKNIGSAQNFKRVFESSKSKYIALCEGDDYWTSINKLQSQITFLENNPEYSMCCHNSENYDNATKKTLHIFPNIKNEKDFLLNDLFNSNIANTCTVVYRNFNIKISEIFNTLPLGDWPLHMLHAEYGKIKFLPENMARYQIHASGIWSSMNRLKQLDASILVLNYMNSYFKDKYLQQFNISIGRHLLLKAFYYLDINEPHNAAIYYKDSQKYNDINVIDKIKYLLKKELPALYKSSSFIHQKIKILLRKVKTK